MPSVPEEAKDRKESKETKRDPSARATRSAAKKSSASTESDSSQSEPSSFLVADLMADRQLLAGMTVRADDTPAASDLCDIEHLSVADCLADRELLLHMPSRAPLSARSLASQSARSRLTAAEVEDLSALFTQLHVT